MTSSSENVETAQDEHHDLLLQHSSGEVGDVKEKWVEKGEEDCERKEGGWHEEGSVEDWEWKGEKAAQKLFEKGSKAIDEGHFVAAKKLLHRALKSRLGFLSLPHAALSPKPGITVHTDGLWIQNFQLSQLSLSVFFYVLSCIVLLRVPVMSLIVSKRF
jgi:hypothetical protein